MIALNPFGFGAFFMRCDMPFVFTFTDGYSKENFLNLNKVFIRKKTSRRILIPLLRIVIVCCGLLLLAVAVEGIIGAMNGTINAVQMILYIGLAVLEIYAGLFYYTRRANRSRKMMVKEGKLSFFIELREDSFGELTGMHKSEYQYSAVESVIFWKDCWFLFLDERHCHILPLANLTHGDAGALASFLAEKTGKQIRYFDRRDRQQNTIEVGKEK